MIKPKLVAKKVVNPYGEFTEPEDLHHLSAYFNSINFANYNINRKLKRVKNKATRFKNI
jgi:hypothetical protein